MAREITKYRRESQGGICGGGVLWPSVYGFTLQLIPLPPSLRKRRGRVPPSLEKRGEFRV